MCYWPYILGSGMKTCCPFVMVRLSGKALGLRANIRSSPLISEKMVTAILNIDQCNDNVMMFQNSQAVK